MFINLKFEFRRIFRVWLWVSFLIVFCLAAIFFVYSGIVEYKNFQVEKQSFLEFERNNVSKYVTYDQYFGYGFRVLYDPPGISVFFSNSDIFDNLYSNIDMTEIIKIYSSYKGRDLFLKKGIFKDLSGLFFIFGSLLMLFMGLTAYKHEKHFFRFANVLVRMALINMVFIILMIILYHIPRIFGLEIFHYKVFFLFCLFSILFLNFFYGTGFFIRSLIKKSKLYIIVLFASWFLSIIIIPEINNIIINDESKSLPSNDFCNMIKLNEVMNFEREVKEKIKGLEDKKEIYKIYKSMTKNFLNSGYVKNRKLEEEINTKIKKLAGKFEKATKIYPSIFFNFLSGEVSGKGYYGHIDFVTYILGLRHNFVNYYLKKKYDSDGTKLENFVKNEENIFKARAHIPKNFWSGCLLTAFYTFILFLAAYLIQAHRSKKKKETFKPDIELTEGDMVYLRCQDKEYMEKIFNHYEQQDDTVCIDNVKGEAIDPGIGLYQTALYFRRFLGARLDRTLEHIEKLGIKDLKKEPYKPEAVKKIYCAAAMAVEKDTIVFKEFIRQESRDFERKFLALLKDTMDMDRTIIYLGVEPLLISSPYTNDLKVDKFKEYPIDNPLNFILR